LTGISFEDRSRRYGGHTGEPIAMNDDEFYLKVAYALSGCQLVEQELKLYITEALQLVKKCIDKRMPFKMRGEDYANASLERLIDIFRKLTDNDVLVLQLSQFKVSTPQTPCIEANTASARTDGV
jgi:hypothetical protein